jgi:hypothetical protein
MIARSAGAIGDGFWGPNRALLISPSRHPAAHLRLDPRVARGKPMAHDIQTILGAIAGGIILVALVLQESPGVLAVARLLLPVGCGPIFFPVCWF